jgi:hypothetical protein
MVWTVVEVGVAITAASLVTIRPLLRVLKFNGFGSSGDTYGASASTSNVRSRNTGQNAGQDEDSFHLGRWTTLSSITGGKSGQNGRVQGTHDAASEEFILQGPSAERNGSEGVMWTRTVKISIDPKS